MPLCKAVSGVFTLPFISAFPKREDLAWRLSPTVYNLDNIDHVEYFFFFFPRPNSETWLNAGLGNLYLILVFVPVTCSLCENAGWPLLHNRLVAFALQGRSAGFVLS